MQADSPAQSTDSTAQTDESTDQLQEAVARARYDDRTAVGDIEDHEVMVVARVDKYDTPELWTHGGGHVEQNEHSELDTEYVGSDTTSVCREFDTVAALDTEFAALVARHDLEELDTEAA